MALLVGVQGKIFLAAAVRFSSITSLCPFDVVERGTVRRDTENGLPSLLPRRIARNEDGKKADEEEAETSGEGRDSAVLLRMSRRLRRPSAPFLWLFLLRIGVSPANSHG